MPSDLARRVVGHMEEGELSKVTALVWVRRRGVGGRLTSDVAADEGAGAVREMSPTEAVHLQRCRRLLGGWFATEGRSFRPLHPPRGGGRTERGTLAHGDLWARLHPDMPATKQRWYCPLCGSRHCTRFGVMSEFAFWGKAMHALADLPSCDSRGANAMRA